jgi:hypothetical protein
MRPRRDAASEEKAHQQSSAHSTTSMGELPASSRYSHTVEIRATQPHSLRHRAGLVCPAYIGPYSPSEVPDFLCELVLVQ